MAAMQANKPRERTKISDILVRLFSWSCHTRGIGSEASRKSVEMFITADD